MNRLDTLYSINKFSKLIGVTPQTLRNWEKEGKLLPVKKSDNGYRYYSEQQRILLSHGGLKERTAVVYCRVSEQNQTEELNKQVESVKTYCIANGYQFEVITDIGSEESLLRDGLNKLVDKVIAGEVSKVVIMNRSILAGSAYQFIESIFNRVGTLIEVIEGGGYL